MTEYERDLRERELALREQELAIQAEQLAIQTKQLNIMHRNDPVAGCLALPGLLLVAGLVCLIMWFFGLADVFVWIGSLLASYRLG